MSQGNAQHGARAEKLAAAIADWRASKPGRGDRDHFDRGYLGEYGRALDACAARHGVDPDLLNQEAAERVTLLPEPDEAEAQHCERLAARHQANNRELADDLLLSADRARNPATGCRPGKRVLTDQGHCRVEEDGQLTPLERPEDVQQRRAMLSGWEAAARESDRRIAAEDAIAARRQCSFAPAARRTPAARPAARRPRARRTASSRAGPSGGDDPPGLPPPPSRRPDLARELAATRLALADALMPSAALWERVRNGAERRAEELRRRG